MEIEYIRKLMSSHMVIAQAAEMAEWEEKMIAHAKVDGILFAECVRENGHNYLWYDITGKQSLDTIVDSSMLGHELMCKILLGLYETVESLEQILLRAEGVLLVPECIFQDYRTEQIFFCYYPGNDSSMAQSLTVLLEYLLARLDHTDERAVELTYGLYERVSKGDISIREIKELIHIPYEEEESAEGYEEYTYQEEAKPDESVEPETLVESRQEEEDVFEIDGKKPEQKKFAKQKFEQIESEREVPRQKRGVLELLFRDRKSSCGNKKSTYGDKMNNYGVKTGLRGNRKAVIGNKKVSKKQIAGNWDILSYFTGLISRTTYANTSNYGEESDEAFVFEPEEEVIPQNVRPTVLLASISQNPQGILRYEGKEPGCGDLQITGTSYVIGSERSCDGCIPSTTVSRRHARITVKEDIYFIEDLNSSNGTYVGGEMLGYKNKVSLQKNEIVIFADEKFRFI